jgi:DNA-binding Lrp family transcriptional regulator
MSRTVLTKVEGFTPVMDNVTKDTSLIAAVVFGSMWRYCQMSNGVCQATLEKIAKRAGLSRQAVIEHIKSLENMGYIEDMTPTLRNRPHTYRDTGKAGLHIGVSGVNDVYSERDEEESTVNDVDSAVNVVDSHSTPRVLEDSIKIDIKKEVAKLPEGSSMDWMIAAGAKPEDITNTLEIEKHTALIVGTFEQAMGYNPLGWTGQKWERLLKFLQTKTPEEIIAFANWCKQPFTQLSPAKARMYPELVIDLWPQVFPKPVTPAQPRKPGEGFYG